MKFCFQVLVIFVIIKLLAAKYLECRFRTIAPSLYTCETFNNILLNKSIGISISGKHDAGKSNHDVESLVFFESAVKFLPHNLFQQFPHIKKFKCNLCFLSSIDKSSLKDAKELKFLALRISNIEGLEEKLFENNHQLREILLGANQIRGIHENTFKGLKRLLKLELWHNDINQLHTNTFSDLSSLMELSLQYNKLEVLEPNLFKNNKRLTILNLKSNRLKVISSGILDHLNNLRDIDFRFNDCLNIVDKNSLTTIKTVFNEHVVNCGVHQKMNSEDLKVKISSQNSQVRKLETRNKELQNSNEFLQKEINKMKEKSENLFEENLKLMKTITDLNEKQNLQSSRCETTDGMLILNMKNARLSDEITKLNGQNSKLKEELKEIVKKMGNLIETL